MNFILSDPRKLNLVFSGVLLAIGLAVYWIWRPRRFHEHLFIERAFEFWVLKWMLFSVTYGLLTVNTDLRFVLAAVDLNSMMGIGFIIALWKGDSYDERHTFMNLVFLCGLLFSWNFISYPLASAKAWVAPSMTVSLLTFLGMAGVVWARHGPTAIAFVLTTLAYLLMQMPGYEILFVDRGNAGEELLKWLAFGKLLHGATFYPIFFSAITNFDPIRFPRFPGLSDRTSKAINWSLAAILGIVLKEGVLWIGKLLWRKISGHSP
jgi:hypothetical protein